MKTKLLTLMTASILVLMFIGFASATTLAEWELTTDEIATTIATNVDAGDFDNSGVTFNSYGVNGANAEDWELTSTLDSSKYFEVTISPDSGYTLTISDIDFGYSASIIGPASFELQYSTESSFGSPTSVTIEDDVSSTEKSSSNSGLNIQVNSGETLTLRWFGYDFSAATNEFRVKDLVIEGTADAEIFEYCEYSNPGELEIKVGDINTVSGFGDDEDFWYLGDEVEIELEFDNKGDYDIEDIEVEWVLFDNENNEEIMDGDESDFDLDEGDDDTMIITLKLNPKDFEDSEDYTFYAWATGEMDDDDNTMTCASDSEDITINVDKNFVILDNLELTPETLQCGGSLHVSADVWNIGSDDQEDVYVRIYNDYLGINEQVDLGDIDSLDDEKLDIYFDIPADVDEKTYELLFQVYDEDDDIYENDEDDTAEFYKTIDVKGNCGVSEPEAVVTAELMSEAKAGEELIVKAKILSQSKDLTTYKLAVSGYSWADSIDFDQSAFALSEGQSKEITLTFQVSEDSIGEQSFDIDVLSGDLLVTTQSVTVDIQAKEGFNWNITGNAINSDNWYLWGIGALNVLLVIIIIIVAIRVAKS